MSAHGVVLTLALLLSACISAQDNKKPETERPFLPPPTSSHQLPPPRSSHSPSRPPPRSSQPPPSSSSSSQVLASSTSKSRVASNNQSLICTAPRLSFRRIGITSGIATNITDDTADTNSTTTTNTTTTIVTTLCKLSITRSYRRQHHSASDEISSLSFFKAPTWKENDSSSVPASTVSQESPASEAATSSAPAAETGAPPGAFTRAPTTGSATSDTATGTSTATASTTEAVAASEAIVRPTTTESTTEPARNAWPGISTVVDEESPSIALRLTEVTCENAGYFRCDLIQRESVPGGGEDGKECAVLMERGEDDGGGGGDGGDGGDRPSASFRRWSRPPLVVDVEPGEVSTNVEEDPGEASNTSLNCSVLTTLEVQWMWERQTETGAWSEVAGKVTSGATAFLDTACWLQHSELTSLVTELNETSANQLVRCYVIVGNNSYVDQAGYLNVTANMGTARGMLMIGGTFVALLVFLILLIKLQRQGTVGWFRSRARRSRPGDRTADLQGHGDHSAENYKPTRQNEGVLFRVAEEPVEGGIPSPSSSNNRKHKRGSFTPSVWQTTEQRPGDTQSARKSNKSSWWARRRGGKKRDSSNDDLSRLDKRAGLDDSTATTTRQKAAVCVLQKDIVIRKKDTLESLDKVIDQLSAETQLATARMLNMPGSAESPPRKNCGEAAGGSTTSVKRLQLPAHSKTSLMRIKLSKNLRLALKAKAESEQLATVTKSQPTAKTNGCAADSLHSETLTTAQKKNHLEVCPQKEQIPLVQTASWSNRDVIENAKAEANDCLLCGNPAVFTQLNTSTGKMCSSQTTTAVTELHDRTDSSKTISPKSRTPKTRYPTSVSKILVDPSIEFVHHNSCRPREQRAMSTTQKQLLHDKHQLPHVSPLHSDCHIENKTDRNKKQPLHSDGENWRNLSSPEKTTKPEISEIGHLNASSQNKKQTSSGDSNLQSSNRKSSHASLRFQSSQRVLDTGDKQSSGSKIPLKRDPQGCLFKSPTRLPEARAAKSVASRLTPVHAASLKSKPLRHETRRKHCEPATRSAGDVRMGRQRRAGLPCLLDVSGDCQAGRLQRSCGNVSSHQPLPPPHPHLESVTNLSQAETPSNSDMSIDMTLNSLTSSQSSGVSHGSLKDDKGRMISRSGQVSRAMSNSQAGKGLTSITNTSPYNSGMHISHQAGGEKIQQANRSSNSSQLFQAVFNAGNVRTTPTKSLPPRNALLRPASGALSIPTLGLQSLRDRRYRYSGTAQRAHISSQAFTLQGKNSFRKEPSPLSTKPRVLRTAEVASDDEQAVFEKLELELMKESGSNRLCPSPEEEPDQVFHQSTIYVNPPTSDPGCEVEHEMSAREEEMNPNERTERESYPAHKDANPPPGDFIPEKEDIVLHKVDFSSEAATDEINHCGNSGGDCGI